MYIVIKHDGTNEPFDRNKIIKAVINAKGLSDSPETVAVAVEEWLKEEAKDGVVYALSIREQVLKALHKIDPVAAKHFEVFTKK